MKSRMLCAIVFFLAIAATGGAQDKKTESAETIIRIHRKSMTLELVENGEVALVFPVRVGKPSTPTPLGEGVIYEKRERAIFRYIDPGPKQGQVVRVAECDVGDGKIVRRKIDYSKIFALGIRIRGMTQYSIHSVTCPETVGKAVSYGCVGMRIEDMLVLYPRVPAGTKVVITDD